MSSPMLEATTVALAQKAMKNLKNPIWNVPNVIPLEASSELYLGRFPGKNKEGKKTVILHSQKLPSMLSRRHAMIKYDEGMNQWTITDLKSLNGVCIGDDKVNPDVAVPLHNGDVICFGTNIDINDLKYTFESQEPKIAVLKRCGAGVKEERVVRPSPSPIPSPSPSPIPSPPLLRGKRGVSEDQRAKTERCAPKKRPRLSDEKDKTSRSGSPDIKIKGRGSLGEKAAMERDCATPKKLEPSVLSILTSTNKSAVSPIIISPAISIASTKPSPALSIASTKSTSDIDELFEGGEVAKCTTAILDEAIFGEPSRGGACSKVLKEHRGLDATSLQIQLANDQMEREKRKLLSSIEALRSELAAKDQLLAEKDEKTKAAEDVGNSVVSSMQEEFTCVICQELFINAYTLPCAHSFCEWCIKEWMKRKGHKDCPICRKKITSDPVHSLALDNAVSKLVEKLSPDEQKERKEIENEHKNSLESLNPAKKGATKKRGSASSATSSSGVSTRSSTAARITTLLSSTVSTPRVVIDLSESPRRTTPGHPIRIDTSTESESDSSDMDDSSDSDDSDVSDPGLGGAYYGGYGRCFNCGRRGHWAPGCPY